MNIINLLKSQTFWTAISAIGTFSAVVTSLYLSSNSRKKVRILIKSAYTTYVQDNRYSRLVVTILNIGDIPIILDECGILCKDGLMVFDEYTVKPYIGKVVKPGDAVKIEYEFNNYSYIGVQFSHNVGKFAIRDTTNQIYCELK